MKTIADGTMTFDAEIVSASDSRVVVRTAYAGGFDPHTWTFQQTARGLSRVSVADADGTENENLPRAWPALARAVARMAKTAKVPA